MAASTCMIPPVIFGCVFGRPSLDLAVTAQISPKFVFEALAARALADVGTTEFQGARAHLRNAAEELTGGRYADSVRESIHAVESVVIVLEPSGDFSKALAKLESKVKIHGALKRGFSSIYGFTSD